MAVLTTGGAGSPALLPLVDHHCHAWAEADLDPAGLASSLTEAAEGPWGWDTLLGVSLRRWCAPVLDLPAGCRPADYAARRAELGGAEVARRFLGAAALDAVLVDTGLAAPGQLAPDLAAMSRVAGAPAHEVLRLEAVAEELVSGSASGPRPPSAARPADPSAARFADRFAARPADPSAARPADPSAARPADHSDARPASAARFADRFAALLAARLAAEPAPVACKSIIAYRHGLDFDPARPGPAEVAEAAAEWLGHVPPAGAGGGGEPGWSSGPAPRLVHPVLLRHLLWAGIDTGLPLQIHTGIGDADEVLHQADPSLLTPFLRATAGSGSAVMLLHTYPYHRQAAYLAGVFPHVHVDVGLATTLTGHRLGAVLAETLELAPFTKLLYSSDAYGLAELHYLGAHRFRTALVAALEPLSAVEGLDAGEVLAIARLIGAGNARRAYRLAGP
ncbi:MAG: amidohydrolase family protein [Acidimicrobiales bacterium]